MALTDPHAAPAQPWAATPLCTLQMTFAFKLFATLAVNCLVLSFAPEGATNAYPGTIVTLTGPLGTKIVMLALPLFDGSAFAVAVSVTGLSDGASPGAR